MQFSTIYDRIKDYSQDKTTSATTRAKSAANDALLRIASEKPWDVLKREGNVSFSSSTDTYNLVSSYSTLNYVTSVWYIDNGIRKEIELVDDTRWAEVYDNDDTGTPEYCRQTYVSGSHRLVLNVTASSAFVSLYSTMYFDYQKTPATLTNDTDVPEVPYPNQHMAIVYFALSDVSAHQGDREAISYWESRGYKALAHAFKQDIRKKGNNLKISRPMMPIYGTVGRSWNNQGEY